MVSNERAVELQTELVQIFTDATDHLSDVAKRTSYDYQGDDLVHLAFQQSAWTDISWGWSEKPYCNTSTVRCKVCPSGGYFFRTENSIGD